MLLLVAAILVAIWLAGFIAHIGGGLVHLILIAALAVFIYHLAVGRRTIP